MASHPGLFLQVGALNQNRMRLGVSDRLAPLSTALALIRRSDCERHGRFFAELTARMACARAWDRERDLLLASRFNAFDYLRTDELG